MTQNRRADPTLKPHPRAAAAPAGFHTHARRWTPVSVVRRNSINCLLLFLISTTYTIQRMWNSTLTAEHGTQNRALSRNLPLVSESNRRTRICRPLPMPTQRPPARLAPLRVRSCGAHALGDTQVADRLQVEPGLRIATEVARQAHRRISRDATALQNNVIDARRWHMQSLCQCVHTETRGFEEVLFQNLAGVGTGRMPFFSAMTRRSISGSPRFLHLPVRRPSIESTGAIGH